MRGRPTKLTPELREQVERYITHHYEDHGNVVPTAAGLSMVIGVSQETLNAWGRQDKRFSESLRRLYSRQEQLLVDGALSGSHHNSTISKLMLANRGYSDKQEVSGPGGGAIPAKVSVQFEEPDDSEEDE